MTMLSLMVHQQGGALREVLLIKWPGHVCFHEVQYYIFLVALSDQALISALTLFFTRLAIF